MNGVKIKDVDIMSDRWKKCKWNFLLKYKNSYLAALCYFKLAAWPLVALRI